LPVLEAMSTGARVVGHNGSAMAEAVGDAGWLVDMRSPDAISGAIREALNCSAMGQRAAQRSRQFSRCRMALETLNVYEKALATGEKITVINRSQISRS
jgi:glycosyltransferase involved in cell wall biosynthesis